MLPYKHTNKQDQEFIKSNTIEKVFTAINESLRSKNIPIFNISKKVCMLEDLCDYLFEIYVDYKQFKEVGFDISVYIESYNTYIYTNGSGDVITNEQPVGTFTITIFNPSQEPWTICKAFSYTIGDCKIGEVQ